MLYSIIDGLYDNNVGKQISVINRQKALNRLKHDGKILTKKYNISHYREALKDGLNGETDIINMYDYFQEVSGLSKHKEFGARNQRYNNIDLTENLVDISPKGVRYYNHDKLKYKVYSFPYYLLSRVDFQDRYENLAKSDLYDYRGFKSAIVYYNADGVILSQKFLNPEGKVKIEVQYMNYKGNVCATAYQLYDYKGKNYLFNNENDLFQFFLKEIFKNKPGDIILDDISLSQPVTYVDPELIHKKYLYIHYTHLNSKGMLSSIYKNFFENFADKFVGVLVANQAQASDIASKIKVENENANNAIQVLPDNVALKEILDMPIHLNTKDDNVTHIGYAGLLSTTFRNFDDFLEICELIKNGTNERIQFDVFTDLNNLGDYNKKIRDKELQNFMKMNMPIKGKKFINEYNKFDIVINHSTSDGGSLMSETALEFGKPLVAYKVLFGNQTVLRNNKNSLLVDLTLSNYKENFAKRVIKLVEDSNLRNKLSQKAKSDANKMNIDNYDKYLDLLQLGK